MNGTVQHIFIASQNGAPMTAVQSVTAAAHRGLVGDRNLRDTAGGKNDSPANEVTLIEREAVEAAVRDYKIDLDVSETRRNIVTAGVALNHFVGQTFRVGPVLLRGVELCEPCKHLEKLTRDGVMRALLHRGGLRAEVLEGGTIAVGNAITRAA